MRSERNALNAGSPNRSLTIDQPATSSRFGSSLSRLRASLNIDRHSVRCAPIMGCADLLSQINARSVSAWLGSEMMAREDLENVTLALIATPSKTTRASHSDTERRML